MEHSEQKTNTFALIVVVIIAVAVAWLLNEAIMNEHSPEIEVQQITNTSESDEVSDIESDMEFDMDSALELDGFEA